MMMQLIGAYSVPIIIVSAAAAILAAKGKIFDEFVKGCREGFVTSVKILPTLVILICAVNMFSASGALDVLCGILGGFTEKIGLPKELIPVILTRPVSGSAATAMTSGLYSAAGPDSFAGFCASVIMGSSDTIIYTLAMYFGAAGITRSRYALPASFAVFAFCVVCSVFITRIFFR